MSLDEVLFDEAWTIAAVVKGGRRPFMQFLDAIHSRVERDRILTLLKHVASHGPMSLRDKSKLLRAGIYEFRPTNQLRIFYFYDEASRERLVLTHGYRKKTNAVNPREIARAMALHSEYRDAQRLGKESI